MRLRHLLVSALPIALLLCLRSDAIDDPIAAVREATKHGEYDKAEKACRDLIAKDAKDPEAHVELANVLLIVGKYPDAEAEARKAIEAAPDFSPAYGACAEALYSTGKYDEAEKVAEQGIKVNDNDLRCRLMRAQARYDTGKYDTLDQSKELEWFFDDYQARGEKWTEREWFWGAQGLWLYSKYGGEGGIAKSLVQNLVNTEFIKTSADLLALLGTFHMEWYDMPGAKSDFKDALDLNMKNPLALLGAEMTGGDEQQANPYEKKTVRSPAALKVNPNFVDAILFEAAQHLGADENDKALECADKALAVNASSVTALAYKAAALFLEGKNDAVAEITRKALAINPKGGDLYHVLGETAGSKRMTLTSYEYLKKGVELDPKNTRLLISLGTCEMNLGEEDDAKKHFDAAWERNRSSVWVANYLQLLDAYLGTKDKPADYVAKTSPHFFYRIHKTEVPWLETYAIELSERDYAEYAKRYHFEPHLPVTLELLAFHNDFSIRAIGLPGIPAAGVCLGRVVGTLSPRAQEEMGPFNWAAVLSHEVSHVFSVQLSDEKTTRWFTEGLATYEEKRWVPGWEFSGGGGWSSDLRLKTFNNYYLGKLIPLENLNTGFGGGDIIFYYYYASLIMEFIEKTYGFDKICDMLKAYAKGKKDTEAFPEVFGMPLKEFEKKFHQWIKDDYMKDIKLRPPLKDEEVKTLEARAAKNIEDAEAMGKLAYHFAAHKEITKAREYGIKCLQVNEKNTDALVAMGRVYMDRANENPKKAAKCFEDALANGSDDYVTHYEYGKLLHKQKERAKAIEQFEAAIKDFPRFAIRNDNPYQHLVDLYEETGDEDGKVRTLERWAAVEYGDFDMRMKLAKAYRDKGEDEKLMQTLEECIWIQPMDIKLHKWLAEGYEKKKDYDKAAQELSFAIAVTKRSNELAEKGGEPGKFDKLIANLWCDVADVRLTQGKKDAAKDAVDQALFLVPDHERAQELKAKLAH